VEKRCGHKGVPSWECASRGVETARFWKKKRCQVNQEDSRNGVGKKPLRVVHDRLIVGLREVRCTPIRRKKICWGAGVDTPMLRKKKNVAVSQSISGTAGWGPRLGERGGGWGGGGRGGPCSRESERSPIGALLHLLALG